MNAANVFNIHLPSGEFWIIPVIGMVSAGLALLVGKAMLGRRRDGLARPVVVKNEAPEKDPFVEGSTTERRSALRRKGNPVEVLLADSEGKKELGRGWVVDRSVGGLAILVEQALAQGSLLSVRPVNCAVGMPWVQLEIRACRQEGTNWELGCRFVRTPPWSILLSFG